MQGQLTPQKQKEYRAVLTKLRAMEERHQQARSKGERQLLEIVRWVLGQWQGNNQAILESHTAGK